MQAEIHRNMQLRMQFGDLDLELNDSKKFLTWFSSFKSAIIIPLKDYVDHHANHRSLHPNARMR